MREKFKEHCDVISGYAFKSADLLDEGDIPVIKIGNISNGRDVIIDNSTQYVDETFNKISENYHIRKGDVLISLTGSHINQPNSMVGRTCRNYSETEYLLNQRAGRVIPKENTSIDYLYYLFSSRAIKENIVTRAYGAANQVNISPTAIGNIKWDFPDKEIQEKIGEKLNVFDELIMKNNKRIKLLEQMAENLYKEWFVRFRFPGHENVEFENGIPKGWEIVKFSDIANVLSGGTPSTEHSEYYDGNIPFYTPKDSSDNYFVFDTAIHITEEGLKHCNSQLYDKNTIMITARGTVGNLNLLAVPMAMNQSCYALNSDIIHSQYYLFFLIKREILKLKKMASGGVFDTIIVSTFDHIKVVLPTNELIFEFDKHISSIMDETLILIEQNNNLTKQRDLLLPRLMSGKLQVK